MQRYRLLSRANRSDRLVRLITGCAGVVAVALAWTLAFAIERLTPGSYFLGASPLSIAFYVSIGIACGRRIQRAEARVSNAAPSFGGSRWQEVEANAGLNSSEVKGRGGLPPSVLAAGTPAARQPRELSGS